MKLDQLKGVFDRPGPYVTVHLDLGRASADAVQQRQARWTTVRHRLQELGVADDVVEDIGERIAENTHVHGEVRRTVVAARDGIVLDDVQAGHTHWPEVVDVGELPDLAGWLAVADRSLPFILVTADREGADIELHEAISSPSVESTSVEGETLDIRKLPVGGWAQKQFQQTAENNWEENAELVADEVRRLAREHATAATLVAGEVRARAEVVKALEKAEPQLTSPVIQIEAGGRAPGASDEALWNEIREVVTTLEREADVAVTEKLDEARTKGEGAATGLDEVVEGLREARVDRLVLDLAALHEKTIKPSSWDGLPLPDSAKDAQELPADRVLVAAGALTGAELTVLPAEMSHGGGAAALLRWA